jgi:uncharacterized damage-inducible protein DinB
MSIAQSILPEFEQEMAGTRKTLERVPDDKLAWKAHPKSNSIGWVAAHLADLPGWTEFTLKQDSLDINPSGGKPHKTPEATSRAAVLETFDKNVATAKKTIAETSDSEFMQPWSLLSGGQTIMTLPKIAVVRGFIMNHIIHHRAILTVYLRLNDIPVPALYGPSGDEQ